jgi:hypothetical protein
MQEFTPAESNTDTNPITFSQETIDSVTELGSILKRIHHRLLSEGYCIMADRIINPQGEIVYEKPTKY